MTEVREITNAIVQEIGKRDARIYELEQQMRDDRKKLLVLRIAIARTAQGFNYETQHLPVLGKSYDELWNMADAEEFGWKTLLWGAVDHFKSEMGVSDL